MRGTAGLGLVAVVAGAAFADPPALRVRETLHRTFEVDRGRLLRGVELREERCLRAGLRLPDGGTGDLADDTPVGLRIGDAVFATTLGADPRWTPGRRRARLPLPDRGVLLLRWIDGEVRVDARIPGSAPHAAGSSGVAEGPLAVDLDAAFRLGDAAFRFAGSLAGGIRHRTVPILGEPVDLPRVRLEGEGRILPLTEDALDPVVAITAPSDGSVHLPGTVVVEGTLRDDRTIVRVTVSLDGGPEVDVEFTRDPATGFLDALLGTFSFPLEAAAGIHEVVVRAYDAAGNVGLARVAFLTGVPPSRPFDAGDGENSAAPGYAAIDVNGQVRRSVNPGTPVAGLTGSVAVAATPLGLLALQPDGTVRALGVNTHGFLGNGMTANSAVPVTVTGLNFTTGLAAAGEVGVALRADGTVWTWGDGRYGALGDGVYTFTPRTTAAPVAGIPPMAFVTGHPYGVAAVDRDGFVWTWGVVSSPAVPAKVAGLAGIVSVAASSSGDFFLAVDGSGEVWSWGSNSYGQCGRTGNAAVPGKIPGITGAKEAACGRDHSLVLLSGGTLVAFGRDLYGTLGDGIAVAPFGALVPVPGFDQVVAVEAGFNSSLAMRADGTVWAWGAINNKNAPTQVTGF